MSSAGSWGGAPDIIDLDRYMRGARSPAPSVRDDSPHAPRRRMDGESARLVVDAGGAGGSPPCAAPPAPLKPTSLSSKGSAPRDKRYSHDSGLSDGSDVFEGRRHRRAATESVSGRSRSQGARGTGSCSRTHTHAHAHTRHSSDSMRNFKIECERALREQQQQLAHVAQLCERLTSSRGEAVAKRAGAGGGGGGGGSRAPERRRSRRALPDATSNDNETSDMSSSGSSHSTQATSKRDRHRSAECKTYKLIMTKLDELNRVFLSRRPLLSAPPPPAPAPPAPAHVPLSEVSVSDKVVATDLPPHHTENYVAYALTSSGYYPSMYRAPSIGRAGHAGRTSCTSHTVSRLVTARAHELDIAPATPATPARVATRPATPVAVRRSGFINVVTESVVAGASVTGRAGGGCSEAEGSDRSTHAPHCPFDLDDPVHLYSQAKRLPGAGGGGGACAGAASLGRGRPARDVHASDSDKSNVHKSLCSLCKGYWRALAGLAAQYFGRPEDT